jgi:FkbM family methyltransferase
MKIIKFRYKSTACTIRAIDGDHITKCIERAGSFYELDLLEAIRAYNRKGTYIDVGAHIGNHSVFFASFCPSTRVVSFEPSKVALECLKANAAYYPIEVFSGAVHNTLRRCQIVDPPPGNHGMTRIEEGDPINGIPCWRLDDLDLNNVAMLKIDVEEVELAVLSSATGILDRDRPIISAEAHTPEATAKLDAFLEPFGYQRRGVYGFTPTHIWTCAS